jgi:hypothetical protein
LKKYVFYVEYGGLGDHLFFSPLPRLLKQLGIANEVYLSSKSPFRGSETYSLVWGSNPYLDGVSNDPPTPTQPATSSINKAVNLAMAQHGILLEQELNPEIYLANIHAQKYVGKHYIDLNYTSFVGAITSADLLTILKKYPEMILVNPSAWLLRYTRREYIRTDSLRDYASLIYSSASFIALASGGATLALALDRPSIVFHGYGQDPLFHHSANNNLRVGGNGLIRKLICHYFSKKNSLRIKLSARR